MAGGILLFEEGQWDRPTVIRTHREPVTAVAFSKDGRFLVTGGLDKRLRVIPVSTP